jgi:methionyl-tRNA synthetase
VQNLASACGISEHVFIRTTEERHRAAVQALWRRLAERGHIYMSTHAGWYAVSDEAFYTAAQVRDASPEEGGSGKVSVETGTPVEWYEEANYKFRLGDFAAPLVEWLESTPDGEARGTAAAAPVLTLLRQRFCRRPDTQRCSPSCAQVSTTCQYHGPVHAWSGASPCQTTLTTPSTSGSMP